MPAEQLRVQLEQLRQALSDVDISDPDTARALQQVADDVHRILGESANGDAPGPSPLKDDVKDLMLKFETEHPHLTEMLSRIANSLANLGI